MQHHTPPPPPLIGARVAGHVGNALSRIVRAGGGLLLFGALLVVSQLFLARVADAQSLTLVDTSVPEGIGTASIRIRNTSGGAWQVTWSTSDGTATAGSDYTSVTNSTSTALAAGATFNANVEILQDAINEGNETFTITVGYSRGFLSGTANFTVTILDDEPFVTISGVTTSYLESFGSTGITVRLTLQNADGTTYTNTANRGVSVTVTGGGATGTTPATKAPDTNRGAGDYWSGNPSVLAFRSTSTRTFLFGINNDDVNEGNESFTIALSDPPGSTGLAGTVDFTPGGNRVLQQVVTIVDDDPPGVTLTPSEVDETDGTVEFTLSLNGERIDAGRPTFLWYPEDGTAEELDDFIALQTPATGLPVVSDDGSPTTFRVEIIDDEDTEGDETFVIVVESPPSGQGAGTIETLRQTVTIRDNDSGPDPILSEISNHLLAQSETILATQPRLADYVRNPGIAASAFTLSASNGGLEALDGGIAGEGFWGEATFSRSESRRADGSHAAATLGAHRQVSNHMFLGGMLQFDRTITKLDGDGRSGEFAGEGWMAGPYVVARDPTSRLFFEGRLLYGRASHDADAVVARAGDDPRDGTFDSERWIAQARVEGEYPLGSRTIIYPLADLSHARNVGNGFDEINENQALETDLDVAIRTAVSKLQLGTEFELPLDPARGDLTFRPGLKLEFADRNGVAFGKSDLASSVRVDLGIDYRLEENVSLGFQGYYSGIGGGPEFESYGAGFRLRMEF